MTHPPTVGLNRTSQIMNQIYMQMKPNQNFRRIHQKKRCGRGGVSIESWEVYMNSGVPKFTV